MMIIHTCHGLIPNYGINMKSVEAELQAMNERDATFDNFLLTQVDIWRMRVHTTERFNVPMSKVGNSAMYHKMFFLSCSEKEKSKSQRRNYPVCNSHFAAPF